MRNAYFYLFYKLYKFSEAAPSKWLSDWKASLVIDILWYCIAFSSFFYYKIYLNRYAQLTKNNIDIFLLVIVVGVPNYFIFNHKDSWRHYNKKFDKLSKSQNRLGSLVVFTVVLLIVVNLLYSFFLLSKIDWTPYWNK